MANYNQVSYGSKGSEVTELQKLLNNNGYQLDEDGIFGSKTQAAVKDYQQKNNLDVDGIVGNNTWGALTNANTGATAQSAATNQSAATANPGFQYGSYQESDTVKQAQALLQQQMANKPGEYTSTWQNQLNDILQQIQNREKFSYDLNGDALYQQYKNQYMLQGQQAMMDTMGQAQAMTGGYGNSYAQSVGQQTYQGYLQQLNDKIPELYQLAMSKYQMEGDEMKDKAALIAQMEDQAYGRYRDSLSDYNTELNILQNQYNTERDYDYGKWADNRDFAYGQYADDRAYDYQTGRDQIADQQWQAEFDEAVRQWNHANGIETAPAGGSSGGGGDSSGGGSTSNWKNSDGTVNIDMINTNTDWWREYAASNGLDPNTGKKAQEQPQDGPTEPTDGFTGSTYSEAVAYMKANGVASANASGILTAGEWSRAKQSGSSRYGANEFNSYQEYLQYAVDANIAAK